MSKKKYRYVITIELPTPEWPRYIADRISACCPFLHTAVVSVQDCQRSDHWYADNNTQQSDTYYTGFDEEEA